MKKKLNDTDREAMTKFLKEKIAAVIEAELNTYKELAVEDHTARLYIFTNLTFGIAHIEFGAEGPVNTITNTVRRFKMEELSKIVDSEYHRFIYDTRGSNVIALISFLPSKSLELPKDQITPEIIQELMTSRDGIDRLQEKYGDKYKKFIADVIGVQVNTFYQNVGYVYKVISHNGEVLDLPLEHTFDMDSEEKGTMRGSLMSIKHLIEVE